MDRPNMEEIKKTIDYFQRSSSQEYKTMYKYVLYLEKRENKLVETCSKLYDMVHDSDLIENKCKANDLYHIFEKK